MKVKSIKALEIIDSRGNPTVKTTVVLDDNSIGQAAVPSGASTGKYEVMELRDNDKSRFLGLGVLKAVENVNTVIAQSVQSIEIKNLQQIDKLLVDLDGTENKSRLGANAILSVSMALARALAESRQVQLYEYLAEFNPSFKGRYEMPLPQFNLLNGGRHANWATDIQEYILIPNGASSVSQALRMGSEIYHGLKLLLQQNNYTTNVGDEGGFAPEVKSNEEPLKLLSQAVKDSGYSLGSQVVFGIDAAASEFFVNGQYNLKKEKKIYDSAQLSQFYIDLKNKYPLRSLEDIFDQDDWEGFKNFTAKVGQEAQVVGDDLYVTNTQRLERGIAQKITNSILIKLNQIGTVTETINAINLAHKNNMICIVSHRSGETDDPFIADLAIGMGVNQIKAGAPARGERTAKYNRLLEIENNLLGNSQLHAFPF